MSQPNKLDFSSIQNQISNQESPLHASELHGVITGLICAGFQYERDDYHAIVNDMFNNGSPLSKESRTAVGALYASVWQFLLDDSYSFQPLLPDDDEAIDDRSHALSMWVQGFNLGFGIVQNKNAVVSDDVQEVLKDFSEIANLSTEVDEDEENEQALFEIQEYVKVSALMIFAELGNLPEDKPSNETLH